MLKNLVVTSSPHLRSNQTTRSIMQEVCLALLPAGIAGVVLFGWNALAIMVTSVLSCVVSEYAFQRISHQKILIGDWSAVVTGLLLAYNIPANAPLWIPLIGGVIAIVLVKQCFGGLGGNFMNPALTARAILFVSWSGIMSNYPNTRFMTDAVSTATPLAQIAEGKFVSYMDLMLGNCAGVLGETCKIAIIIGGLYLILRGIVDWRIPVCFIGTAFICYLIQDGFIVAYDQILSGGLLLGAFFMATDYVTCPMSGLGRVIFGVGCGLLLFVIRSYASYIEGCSFAILFMNVMTPLIDRFTAGKLFGEVKTRG
ncbi:MAG: RnfABCDGE type electron transport complex subunit D [Clostridia bacterium]|nr:RnfABCDGE type electron transport complex subunit D [Clostridia bacterium]